MATPTLLGLPTELIVKFFDEVQPEDHFNGALACKRLYQLSEDVIKWHQLWHGVNSLCSDLLPGDVPRLLDNVLLDPIAAWHIRDLEFWVIRRSWDQWAIDDPDDEPEERGALVKEHGPPRAYVFTKDGNKRLMACLVRHLGYSEAAANDTMELIMKGEEEPLKLLLIALAPGLRSVKFPNLYLDSRNRRRATAHPLTLLSQALVKFFSMRELVENIWPPGFRSLRSVSIGVRTSSERGFIYPFPFIAPLFLLPNLEYLYLDHPHSGFDQGESRFHLPRRTSTVKHVHITSCDLEIVELSEMLAGIATLKSFSLQSLQRNGCDVIRLLGMHHGDTLEYLDMCDTDILHRLYEKYFSRLSLDGLKMFPDLKYIAIDLLVLLHQHTETRYAHPGQLVTLKPHADVDRVDLSLILTPSIEFIAFKISNSNYVLTDQVGDAVSKLVAKEIRSGVFPNLRAVFFEGVSPQKPSPNYAKVSNSNDVSWFMDVIVAGSEKGVEVCTAWTHPGREMKKRKDELGIPRAVSARDMRTDRRNM